MMKVRCFVLFVILIGIVCVLNLVCYFQRRKDWRNWRKSAPCNALTANETSIQTARRCYRTLALNLSRTMREQSWQRSLPPLLLPALNQYRRRYQRAVAAAICSSSAIHTHRRARETCRSRPHLIFRDCRRYRHCHTAALMCRAASDRRSSQPRRRCKSCRLFCRIATAVLLLRVCIYATEHAELPALPALDARPSMPTVKSVLPPLSQSPLPQPQLQPQQSQSQSQQPQPYPRTGPSLYLSSGDVDRAAPSAADRETEKRRQQPAQPRQRQRAARQYLHSSSSGDEHSPRFVVVGGSRPASGRAECAQWAWRGRTYTALAQRLSVLERQRCGGCSGRRCGCRHWRRSDVATVAATCEATVAQQKQQQRQQQQP